MTGKGHMTGRAPRFRIGMCGVGEPKINILPNKNNNTYLNLYIN